MKNLNENERLELEEIRHNEGGVLRADAVVDAAQDPSSALHHRFQWNDTEAARKYRILQARWLIKVAVTIIPSKGEDFEVQAYVSMHDDRKEEGGGYRAMVDVLSNADQRKKLLAEALKDFERFERKYKLVKALAPVFAAMRKVKRSKQPVSV